jgi:hypothetical protein
VFKITGTFINDTVIGPLFEGTFPIKDVPVLQSIFKAPFAALMELTAGRILFAPTIRALSSITVVFEILIAIFVSFDSASCENSQSTALAMA